MSNKRGKLTIYGDEYVTIEEYQSLEQRCEVLTEALAEDIAYFWDIGIGTDGVDILIKHKKLLALNTASKEK